MDILLRLISEMHMRWIHVLYVDKELDRSLETLKCPIPTDPQLHSHNTQQFSSAMILL